MNEQQLWDLAEQVLTPLQLRVFKMHHRDGFSQRQIAACDGVSRSTVQSRLEAARTRLLRAINQEAA